MNMTSNRLRNGGIPWSAIMHVQAQLLHFFRLATCLTLCVLGSVGVAQAATEYEVKTAFIFNFLRFTEWPPEALKDNIFRLCVLGRDPLGDALNALRGKQIQGRDLQIIQVGTSLDALACHAVYIAPSEQPRLSTILATSATRPILTLSDVDQFVAKGGMIGLTLVDERVRFEVSLIVARESKLRINSQVLKLAHRVIDTKGAP